MHIAESALHYACAFVVLSLSMSTHYISLHEYVIGDARLPDEQQMHSKKWRELSVVSSFLSWSRS